MQPDRPGVSWTQSSLFYRIAAILVGLDLLLILINVIVAALRMVEVVTGNIDAWLVFHETSIASYLIYAKWAVMAGSLGAAGAYFRAPVLAAFAALFVYILLDDTLQIHEWAGAVLAERMGLTTVLAVPPEDVGQFLFLGGVGGLFVLLLAGGYWLSARRWRRFSLALFAGLAGLALFGVGVDVIHSMTNSMP